MKAQDLKNSILQMAVQGKLVEQDPADEPASALLERIRVEHAELIKQKKVKAPKGGESVIYREGGSWYECRGKSEPACIDDEIPFEIPESWEWCRLSSIARVQGGKRLPVGRKLSETATSQKYIRVSDMYDGGISLDNIQYVPEDLISKIARYTISKDDVFITVAGTIGRTGTVPKELDGANLTENADKLVITGIDKYWLYRVLSSPMLKNQIAKCTTQVGQPKLAIKRIEDFMIPLPPLAEQKHIVECIDELMPLVEEYGKLEDAREALDAALPDRLRKSILQMAVQGKLVPQDSADGLASVLLERIRGERAKLIKQKKIKAPKGGESVIYREAGSWYERRGKSEPACIDDEIPFKIPESWEWVRLSGLIVLMSGVDLSPSEYNDANRGIPYLTGASNFSNGSLIENRWTEKAKRISKRGELLFTCKGTVGEMAINSFDEAHIARQIMAIDPTDPNTLAYIQVFLSSMVASIKAAAKGVIPGIERGTLLDALLPIPPLAEQQRIVQRVDELMTLINQEA